MRLRRYDRPDNRCDILSRKLLRARNPKLSELSERFSIASVDEAAFALLSGPREITFRLGIGATGKTEVFLRNLVYAAISLEIARKFDGRVEFVSGGGIASNAGLVDLGDINDQIARTFDLVRLFVSECYPDIKVEFSIPSVSEIRVIDDLVTLVEKSSVEARKALAVLGSVSIQKNYSIQCGKRYGVLHAFAFDLRDRVQDSIVTIGNPSEDTFNCVRYWVLKNIYDSIDIGGVRWFPPQNTGHVITNRCNIPPYANGRFLGDFELEVTLKAIETLKRIKQLGRKRLLEECDGCDTQTSSNIGSVIKDFELLIGLVGIDAINKVVERFTENNSSQKTARSECAVEVSA